MRSLLVTISAEPSPTRVPLPIAQVLIFQVVRLSGISISMVASPFSFVSTEPTHFSRSANSERTIT